MNNCIFNNFLNVHTQPISAQDNWEKNRRWCIRTAGIDRPNHKGNLKVNPNEKEHYLVERLIYRLSHQRPWRVHPLTQPKLTWPLQGKIQRTLSQLSTTPSASPPTLTKSLIFYLNQFQLHPLPQTHQHLTSIQGNQQSHRTTPPLKLTAIKLIHCTNKSIKYSSGSAPKYWGNLNW